MLPKALGLVALCVVALTLTACGGSVSAGGGSVSVGIGIGIGIGPKTYNTADLEAELATKLAPQGKLTPSDITVSCPDDIPVKKGHRFDCKLTVNDDRSTVVVKVTETNDEGHVTATVPPQKATTAPTS
ncbi:MAG: hypothetical protein JWP17_3404 [Solirubrobacterales bacterium]|nr:hypothetical protein [Solirubrobacterales bacterium]